MSGAGAPRRRMSHPITSRRTAPTPFGVENYELAPEEAGGSSDTQAGSHPFQLTTTLALNQTSDPSRPPALAKDLNSTPAGTGRQPDGVPAVSRKRCSCSHSGRNRRLRKHVPAHTGSAGRRPFSIPAVGPEHPFPFLVPLFNLTPERWRARAASASSYDKSPCILDTSVRTGADYGVTVSVDNISQEITFISSRVTVLGRTRRRQPRRLAWLELHRAMKATMTTIRLKHRPAARSPKNIPAPFLALPTSCTGPLQTTVEADSWRERGVFNLVPDARTVARARWL